MYKSVILIYLFICAINTQTTNVDTCNGSPPLPLNVHLEGCETPPCDLISGTYAKFNVIFQNPTLTKSLNTRAVAYISILPIPYDLGEQSNACLALTNTYCPILAHELVSYSLDFYIDPIFPTITVPLEYSLVNDDSTVVACFRLRISVRSASSSSSTIDDSINTNNTLLIN